MRTATLTVGQQSITMLLQPAPRSRAAGGQAFYKTPETRAVVYLNEMSHLMGDDIIEHRLWG